MLWATKPMSTASSSDEDGEEETVAPIKPKANLRKVSGGSKVASDVVVDSSAPDLTQCFYCYDAKLHKFFNKAMWCRRCFLGTRAQRHQMGYDPEGLKNYKTDMWQKKEAWRDDFKAFCEKEAGKCRNAKARLDFRAKAQVIVLFFYCFIFHQNP